MNETYLPINWKNEKLLLLDQRLLPHEEVFLEITNLSECITAIRDMVVRGAPCIGFTAIYGLALWVRSQNSYEQKAFRKACDDLINARPTAVNLSFEVNRCFEFSSQFMKEKNSLQDLFNKLVAFGELQLKESFQKNLIMAKIGFKELDKKFPSKKWRLMTHCNTGFLACGSLGTALGVISHAHTQGRVEQVIVDETRPYLQGTRLTAFELSKEKIPYKIVVEGAASYLLSHGFVDAIFVGADRIAANGDTANKVGTSTLAIVAKHYNIPFYVVAPLSSFDTSLPSGHHIEIEMRASSEVLQMKGDRISPAKAESINPSFDVTDHQFITGIICEKGLIDPKNKGELIMLVHS